MEQQPNLQGSEAGQKRVVIPGLDEPKKEERKGVGFWFWLPGAQGLGPVKIGIALLALGGGSVGLVGVLLSRRTATETGEFRGSPDFTGETAAAGIRGGDLGSPSSASSPDEIEAQRRSSIGFVAGNRSETAWGVQPAAEAAGAPTGAAGSSTAPPGTGAGSGAGGAKGGLLARLGGAFGGKNIFSGSPGMGFKGFRKLDNPNLNEVKDFRRSGGGRDDPRRKMQEHLRSAQAHLQSKEVGKSISASKAMGQLKFTGARSGAAAKNGSENAAAAYGEQAFGQEERERGDMGGLPGVSGAPGGPAGPGLADGAGGAGGNYSVDTGGQIGFGGGSGGCPAGWIPTPGGGCEPAAPQSKDSTLYDSLVTQAWSLIKAARKATKRLDLWSATEYAAEAEKLGDDISQIYGQTMQGEIIRYWADRSNELNHWHKAKKNALEKRREEMDPKLDNAAGKSVKESRDAGYR